MSIAILLEKTKYILFYDGSYVEGELGFVA